MSVGIAGSGPAAESVVTVLEDEGVAAESIDPGELSTVALAVVVKEVGAPAFGVANEAALAGADTEWIGVELGGIGGHALEEVEATVAGFEPEGSCFECLGARVAANVDPATGEEMEATGTDRDRVAPGRSGSSNGIDSATARLAGTIAGRNALRTLAGASVAGAIELPYAERDVLAVPNCRCSPERERENRFGGLESLDREGKNRELEAAVARAERALDPRVGVVNEIGEAASFPVPYYLARLGDTSPFSDARASPRAAGVAADWNAAFMKAIGEAMERYCAGVYRTGALPRARAENRDRVIAPAEFVRPDGRGAIDEPIRWVAGEALASGSDVAVPASVALFPPPEERVRPAITTGLGLGNSGTEALLSGLYEVIERDATMLGWYSTYEALGLEVGSERFATLRGRARAEDLSVDAVLVTQDVDVPVVAVAVHREDEWPRFAVGSDADLDAARAAESALAEALQNWTELGGMGEEDAIEAAGAIGHYADFPPAARAFLDVDRVIPAESVGTAVSGREELETVLDRLAGAGLDSYGVRLTTRDIEALGFEAVRALVPEAQPLFTGEPFFGERAHTVPEELGFEPRLGREPHPYP